MTENIWALMGRIEELLQNSRRYEALREQCNTHGFSIGPGCDLDSYVDEDLIPKQEEKINE